MNDYQQTKYDAKPKKKGVPDPDAPWWSNKYDELVCDIDWIEDSDEHGCNGAAETGQTRGVVGR